MKNIPVYISTAGTATLILQEIPRTHRAYILLQTIQEGCLKQLLDDCLEFCRQSGAESCYVSHGTDVLPLPHAYDILILAADQAAVLNTPGGINAFPGTTCANASAAFAPIPVESDPKFSDAGVVCIPEPTDRSVPLKAFTLVPLSPEHEKLYVKIYNRCFTAVSHAVGYDRSQLERIYRLKQRAYLAYTAEGTAFGIGELHDNELAAVAVLPEFHGCGTRLTKALIAMCPGPEITLTVASDNERALHMYEKLNFRVRAKESAWYKLL